MFFCEIVNKLPQHSRRPKDWNQSLLRRGPFLPASVSRIANRTHLSPALFASPEFIFPAHIPIQQLLLIELLKYESLISSCNWSLFLYTNQGTSTHFQTKWFYQDILWTFFQEYLYINISRGIIWKYICFANSSRLDVIIDQPI